MIVRYGAEADAALTAAVASAQRGDPLAPVTVIVPTGYVGAAARRRLAARSGLAAVTFTTVHRLAELLGAPALAGAGRRPVSTPVLAAAVRHALARHPGVFASVREHPSTEQALARAHVELRDLTPAALDRLGRGSTRAGDVVRLHRAVTADLRASWYDEIDLLAAARAAVMAQVPLVAATGTLVVHLPQELSAGSTALLVALGAVAPVQVIAGMSGVPTADLGVWATLAALGVDPTEHDRGASRPPCLPASLEVLTASDADEEVRAAVRAVVAAARSGTSLDRMAVCYGSNEPYRRLVAEHLDAAGIARNGAAPSPLRERVAGRTLLGLFALHDHGLARDAVFELLATAPLRDRTGRPVPVARWERRSRDAGIVAGRDQWDLRLARLADTLDDEAARAEADPDEGRGPSAARRRRRAGDARALRSYVLDLADRLDPARLPTTWSGLARAGASVLVECLGSSDERTQWPEPERRAAEAVDALLERLAGLDDVDPATTPAVFRRTLELELDADSGRQGRLGDGVFVGPIASALGQRPELLVVVGLAEGSFPAHPIEDVLLPDRERILAPGLVLAADRTARQHRQLLAAVAGAERTVLCVPRGDLRQSADRAPSRWVLELLAAHGGRRADPAALDQSPGVHSVASFTAGLSDVGFPPTAQEQRLRSLLDHVDAGHDAVGHPSVLADAGLRRAAALVEARRSAAFTAYDGNLAGIDVPSPFDAATVVAPTRLEAWVSCPHAYFVRQVLGVDAIENPEDRLAIAPIDAGALVHAVLDQFTCEVLERPPAERPGPDDAWTASDEQRLLELFDDEAGRYEALGLTGRAVFWARDRRRLQTQLRRYLRSDSARRRALRTTTVASELRFGLPGARHGPVAVTLDDGRTVRFRGSADRVDRGHDGSLVVVDYKTGRMDDALSAADPTARGRRLQLPVYALAARQAFATSHADSDDGDLDGEEVPVRSHYWLLKHTGDKAIVGIDYDADAHARFVEVLATIAAGMASGTYCAHPEPPGWMLFVPCWYCDPDGLGTGARHREWERKKHDPRLAGYLALAEGGP